MKPGYIGRLIASVAEWQKALYSFSDRRTLAVCVCVSKDVGQPLGGGWVGWEVETVSTGNRTRLWTHTIHANGCYVSSRASAAFQNVRAGRVYATLLTATELNRPPVVQCAKKHARAEWSQHDGDDGRWCTASKLATKTAPDFNKQTAPHRSRSGARFRLYNNAHSSHTITRLYGVTIGPLFRDCFD